MEKIVQFGKDRFNSVKNQQTNYARNDRADKLLNDIENNPHVFVLACLMDRQIKAEKAWNIPQKIFDLLDTHNLNKLSEISIEQYKNLFTDNNLHRFNNDMAEIFFFAIQDIKSKYNGNASEIWKGRPSSASVVYRFLEFKGCGIKIATMATNILARQFKIELSDYYSIDISPDVHIKRVLARMGLVPQNPSSEMVIYKARELNPEFPGIIDLSCWEIGTTWCKATNPKCSNCVVKDECKKII
jgi:endonuclease III